MFFPQYKTVICKGVHCARHLDILQYLVAVFFTVDLNVKNCLLILLLTLFIPWWICGLKWHNHCGLAHHCPLLANKWSSVMYSGVCITSFVAECLFFIVQKVQILICTALFRFCMFGLFILIIWDHSFLIIRHLWSCNMFVTWYLTLFIWSEVLSLI